ncbi:AAA family ATPase [Natrialbaceae archaeon A-CW3]
MKLKTITLDNIRSYDTETIEFSEGANIVHGKNGAGKSTILQGVFGGLFQTKMTDEISSSFTLDKLVRNDTDEGRIELSFEISGVDYTTEWCITVSENEDGERSAKTKPGYPTLDAEVYNAPISGVRDVREEMVHLLGMDAESFVNSVYVQQGDITRLIHAKPDDRREIIDGLLGLKRVDTLIERMDEARREFKRGKRDAKAHIQSVETRLDDMPDEEEVEERIEEVQAHYERYDDAVSEHDKNIDRLHEAKTDTKTKLGSIEETRDELEEFESQLELEREDLQNHLDTIEQKKAERDEAKDNLAEKSEQLEDDINTAQSAVDNVESDYALDKADTANTALDDAKEAAEEARSNFQSIKEGELSTANTELQHLNETLSNEKEERDDEKETLEDARNTLEDEEEELERARIRVDDLESQLNEVQDDIATTAENLGLPNNATLEEYDETHIPNERVALRQRREEVNEELGRLNTLTNQVDELLEGDCPLCGATEENHDHNFSERADELAEKRADAQERLEQAQNREEELNEFEELVDSALSLKNTDLVEAEQDVERVQDRVDLAKEKIDDTKERIEGLNGQIGKVEEKISEKENEIESIKNRIEAAEDTVSAHETVVQTIGTVVDRYETIATLRNEVERYTTEIEHANSLRREKQRVVADLERRCESLREELKEVDVEELEKQLEQIENQLEKQTEKRNETKEKREEARNDLAEEQAQLQNIQDAYQRKADLKEHKKWSAKRESEAEEVIEAYEKVRSSLRAENIILLNKYTNEVFKNLYQHESYQGVKIDEEYNIQLVGTDGMSLEPELSSGGEGCLLNLALRAGVYRIISERDGANGITLPPLILDEPSTHLDSGHVSELNSMINTISEWDVPQVVVVDHNEHLVQNADNALHVEKDPSTKTSRVTQGNYSHIQTPNETPQSAESSAPTRNPEGEVQ